MSPQDRALIGAPILDYNIRNLIIFFWIYRKIKIKKYGSQSPKEEGKDNGYLGVGMTIVKKGGRKQRTLGCMDDNH